MPIHLDPQRSYSPDLAPLDFFLFGSRKTKMLRFEFDSPEALLDWIKAESQRVHSESLEGVFESWIIRVQKCVKRDDDYFLED
jgi:hypothetical protein